MTKVYNFRTDINQFKVGEIVQLHEWEDSSSKITEAVVTSIEPEFGLAYLSTTEFDHLEWTPNGAVKVILSVNNLTPASYRDFCRDIRVRIAKKEDASEIRFQWPKYEPNRIANVPNQIPATD